jgi:aminoglycoside phosphotransferase (APT) family kinase protein
MIQGAPPEAGWFRLGPRRVLEEHVLDRVVQIALPGRKVIEVYPLTDGFRNANFRLHLDSPPEHVVLRIYEHDVTLCRKETDILKLMGCLVPTPEVIYSEPDGMNGVPPLVLLRYIEGMTFRELKCRGDADSISRAAYAVGQTLASIGRVAFPKAGWLGPGPSVGSTLLEGENSAPRFVDLCLTSLNLRQRMKEELRGATSALVWSYAAQLASLGDENHLAHGDFGGRNLLVRHVAGKWVIAGVLDWEFAIAGSPLVDVGHFLRYESLSRPVVEPHFSNGYMQAGGTLPPDWRRLARMVDLIALCESLTHDAIPDEVVAELLELVRATVESRDPQFK